MITVEKRIYNYFEKNYYDKAREVSRMVEAGKSSEQIAVEIAGPKMILGAIILLAANHMKKTGIRLR